MSIHSEDETIIQKGNTQSSVIIIKPREKPQTHKNFRNMAFPKTKINK